MRPWSTMPALLMLLACGCAGTAPPLVPVTGQVTLDKTPLPGKTVKFIPEDGTPGVGAGGNSDQNGQYSLLAIRPGATRDMAGVPSGRYRVIVTEPMFPIDLPVQNANEQQPTPAIGIPAEAPKKKTRVIPAQYTNAETTPLRVEVPREGGEIKLELLSNMPQK